MQNGHVESFNDRMRDELLNETLFIRLDHARALIAAELNKQWPASTAIMPNNSARLQSQSGDIGADGEQFCLLP